MHPLIDIVLLVITDDVESSMKCWSEVSLEEKLDSAQPGASYSGIEVNVDEQALSGLFTEKGYFERFKTN